jgi:beta-galactosidase
MITPMIKSLGCLWIVLISASISSNVRALETPRERISLNAGWRFTKDDPAGTDDRLSYPKIKDWILPTGADFTENATLARTPRPAGNPGGDVSYAQPGFDDSQWRSLNLPHDWGVEGPFNMEYPSETGKLPWWGVGWYRKHLEISAADQGRRIFLDVDGAMSYSTVWLNGQCVGGWPYGYTSWRVDLTDFVEFGGDNVIAIRLDNPKESTRWYPGGGIYRNVWLVKTAPVRVAHWGTRITTPQVSEQSSTVKIQTRLDNSTGTDAAVVVRHEIFELDATGNRGKSVASQATPGLKISSQQSAAGENELVLQSPRLWSIEHPQLYLAVTTVEQNGKAVDRDETPFGIRTFAFTADQGFLLNGREVDIKGVCLHHDLGALGTALNLRAVERQLEILKEMGCNAIRTSHNPPAPEFLDFCDRMGFVVMAESFDCWRTGKNKNDYHVLYQEWHEQDLRALVRRDRNHRSIVLWSSGNEVPDQDKPAGPAIAREHAAIIKSEDDTRPVTTAVSSKKGGFSGFQKEFDVFGWNYKPAHYGEFRAANSNLPIIGSETSSTVSSRGEYFFPVSENKDHGKMDFQVSSYDLYAPEWATTPDAEFEGQDKNPFVAGEFVWTGFDYLGEPTPYNWDLTTLLNFTDPVQQATAKAELEARGKINAPARSSYFGILDLAGFRKDRYYLYQARWRPEIPLAHILPHWNWPERVGEVTPVHVYTSCDAAELFLNGRSLGLKKRGPYQYRLRWDEVIYEPGELKVVAYKQGKEWAANMVRTTGTAAALSLTADRASIRADGHDLSFITVKVHDSDGLLVPRSKNPIRFEIEGPGEIVVTDNGDPTDLTPFQSPERKAFNGLALVVVRAKPGLAGEITLKADSKGLTPAAINLRADSRATTATK